MLNHPPQADLEQLIVALLDAQVEFIIVGGAACVLQGAPTTTQDLDIVHQRTAANVDRLLAALHRLDAVIRDPAKRLLRPSRDALLGTGQLNLSTTFGPLDPLCQLHDGRGYDELIGHTDVISDGQMVLRVLNLQTLIDIKAHTGRARDRLIVPILLQLMKERET